MNSKAQGASMWIAGNIINIEINFAAMQINVLDLTKVGTHQQIVELVVK